jgi:hypothetical protein
MCRFSSEANWAAFAPPAQRLFAAAPVVVALVEQLLKPAAASGLLKKPMPNAPVAR